jgi:predicted 3-demethylubiquinone-9 3-methyltransferase (glyoxalase superfamily)
MQGITPFLWFDTEAEQAAELYTSVFPDSSIDEVSRYGEAGPGEPGTAMSVNFRLDGSPFIALNGGPMFTFTEAISFVITCKTQEEVDHYWESLSAGGEKGQCGWLKDRFGLSWQVVPTALGELLSAAEGEQAMRVTQAMLQMTKLEIAGLQAAFDNE